MEGGAHKVGFRRRFSPSSTIVPDSQSPEPPHQASSAPPKPSKRSSLASSSSSDTFRQPTLPSRRRPPPPPAPVPHALGDQVDVKPPLPADAASLVSTIFSSETSVEPPQVKQEEDVKPKLEDLDDFFSSAGFRTSSRTPSERSRSNAPEPQVKFEDEGEQEDVKPKIEADECAKQRELTKAEKDRRVRERAPSAMPFPPCPPKEEDEDEWVGVRRGRLPRPPQAKQVGSGASTNAAQSAAEEQGPPGAVAECGGWLNNSFGGGFDRSSASPHPRLAEEQPFVQDDERDRPSMTSVSPEPRIDEEEEEDAEMETDELEQTPFEESERDEGEDEDEDVRELGGRRKQKAAPKKGKGKRPAVVKEVVQRKKSRQEQQAEEEAENFLKNIDRPLPRGAILKAKIRNELAANNQHLLPFHVVEAVPVPIPSPRPASPIVVDEQPEKEQQQVEDFLTAATSGAGPSQGAGLEELDDLPDYDEVQEAPEVLLEPKKEEVTVAKQIYFEKPSRRGAVSSWVALLGKNASDLGEPFSFSRYEADRKLLLDTDRDQDGPRLSRSALDLINTARHVLSPDFLALQATGNSDLHTLLSKKPSAAVIEQLWTDFLHPEHPARHRRPDEAETQGQGRGCFCPLYVPEKRMDWEEKKVELEESGLDSEDLLEVVSEVFGGTRDRLARMSAELGIVPKEGELLLEQIYLLNWIWFDQIVELASIALVYKNLCDHDIVNSVVNYLAVRSTEEPLKCRELERKKERARGTPQEIEYHRERLMREGRWSGQERDLEALLKRLRSGTDGATDYAATTAPSLATATTNKATYPRAYESDRPLPTKPIASTRTFASLPYARPETPGSKQKRFEGWQEKDAGPGSYHWRGFQYK